MTFSSLWPLAFLLAVPIIIILYILKPRGKDVVISSNMLWAKLFKNVQSKTYFEKFVHNILMYLQIVAALLLILALMSPFITVNGVSSQNVILVLDTSASMQHKMSDGKTRLEKSIDKAIELVDSSDNSKFTIITCSNKAVMVCSTTNDKTTVKKALREIECTDIAGDITKSYTYVNAVLGSESDKKSKVIVMTDGQGVEGTKIFADNMGAEISVVGDAVSNVALEYMTCAKNQNTYDVAVKVTNYSNYPAAMDITLYDMNGNIQKIAQVNCEADSGMTKLFTGIAIDGEYVKAEITGITFEGSSDHDSLNEDNTAYATKDVKENVKGALISYGNGFIEKVYNAVTNDDIDRMESDGNVTTGGYNVAFYDKGMTATDTRVSRMVFVPEENISGTLNGVKVTFPQTKLTKGLSEFTVGVNEVNYYVLPSWGVSFMEVDGKCVGYYGEHDGYKEIVIGFDIRESDFALSAEFPVFMVNAMEYLSDSSAISGSIFYPGDKVSINPSNDVDVSGIETPTDKAGIYSVQIGEKTEYYIVRFAKNKEADGRITGVGQDGTNEYSELTVKKNVRDIFLIIALIMLVVEWIIYLKQTSYKGKFYWVVRIVTAILVIISIFGLYIPKKSTKVTTVFVVDLSDSNKNNLSEISKFIEKQIVNMPDKNQYGIVSFGKDAQVEQFLTDSKNFAGIMAVPNKNATNYEEAIESAIAMIPDDSQGRLVILTDAKETSGDIFNTASDVTASNIEINTVIFESSLGNDVYVSSVDMPSYLHPGDQYSLDVTVNSNYDTDAVIDIMNGSKSVYSKQVHLTEGRNQFSFPMVVQSETMENYDVKVTAVNDECDANNKYSAYGLVEAPPKVLLVSGLEEDSTNFKLLLNSVGVEYDAVSVKNAPSTLEDMLAYKCIIVENAHFQDMPKGFTNNLETYVKDYGCGLITTGGEESYALGGYRDTVFDEILPIDMQLMGTNEIPDMAMVLIIDHSGSMYEFIDGTNETNLTLAIEATCEAVNNLRDSDKVGVLTFDDGYTWQVPIQKCDDREGIKAKIEDIDYGGGTTIKPAVEEAYNQLVNTDAAVKHIVLLTDGMGETTNFSDVTKKINEAGITLSTVAVGEYSDTELLENLANSCNGRYYYSDISTDIPRIFAQEVFLGGDSYLKNGDYSLSVLSSNVMVSGLYSDGISNIKGYVAATKKNTATGVIEADTGEPILTTWQYGLGRTTAWNSDVTNEWTSGFAADDDYAAMWKKIIEYTAGSNDLGNDDLSISTEKGKTIITYTAYDYSENTDVKASYTDPSGNTGEVALDLISPGIYQGVVDSETPGLYNYVVIREDDKEITNSAITAEAVQFSDEYRFDISDVNYRTFISQYGKEITLEDSVWQRIKKAAIERHDITNLIIILAIILFIIDVAVRRFNVIIKKPEFIKKSKKYREEEEVTSENSDGQNENIDPKAMEKAAKKALKQREKEAKRAAKKRNAKGMEDDNLDTSALLKKRDDRNG